MDPTIAAQKRMLNLHELEELHLDAYENALIYKEKTKRWHGKCITRQEFNEVELVLLFNSRLNMFLGNIGLDGRDPSR